MSFEVAEVVKIKIVQSEFIFVFDELFDLGFEHQLVVEFGQPVFERQLIDLPLVFVFPRSGRYQCKRSPVHWKQDP